MKFLESGAATRDEIVKLLSDAKTIKIAVAYWGDGATQDLGFDKLSERNVSIICDLRSGGCNPAEVTRLQEALGERKVRMLDGLHAKVWLTEKAAIVGSSNASANGLGQEGWETSGLIEANYLIEDKIALKSIDKWFDGLKSKAIKENDLEIAKIQFRKNRQSRPGPRARTLLEAVSKWPENFENRDFFVSVYNEFDLDPPAEEECIRQAENRHEENLDCFQNVARIPDHSYLLVFTFENGRAEYEDLYQTVDNCFIEFGPAKNGKRENILLFKPAKFFGLRATPDREAWEDAATRAAAPHNGIWDGKMTDFYQFLK